MADNNDNKSMIGTEEERKKMKKKITARKKYHVMKENPNGKVEVSEEEIDAEIKKMIAKLSGSDVPVSSSSGEMLKSYVQYDSEEYKLEKKRAGDRLRTRKKCELKIEGKNYDSSLHKATIAEIEAEMLASYREGKAGKEKNSQGIKEKEMLPNNETRKVGKVKERSVESNTKSSPETCKQVSTEKKAKQTNYRIPKIKKMTEENLKKEDLMMKDLVKADLKEAHTPSSSSSQLDSHDSLN